MRKLLSLAFVLAFSAAQMGIGAAASASYLQEEDFLLQSDALAIEVARRDRTTFVIAAYDFARAEGLQASHELDGAAHRQTSTFSGDGFRLQIDWLPRGQRYLVSLLVRDGPDFDDNVYRGTAAWGRLRDRMERVGFRTSETSIVPF